ncbi:MAG: iron ABC transporter permease, partial [Ignavibacteriae bacterium]|nr:iron ABC transporter permease [Ignavibacteriota bacterium]
MGKSKPLNKNSYILQLILFASLTIIVGLISLSIGSVNISFTEIISSLFANSNNEKFNQVIMQIRLPRVLFAIFIGGGLGITGAVFQAILMNPLAEPYILGISSGGTFGAVLSMLIGASIFGTQVFAFSGAILVMFLVFFLGRKFHELNPNVLLLSGVMIGAFFSAAILLIIIFLNSSLRTAVYWMIGSLSFAKPDNLFFMIVIVSVSSIYLSLNANKFNLLSLGDETAKSLGINSSKLKMIAYFVSSIVIGTVVSVSGIIGFVGLTIPHLCRLIWGVDNRTIIPLSFFIGAIYLTVADTIARVAVAPSELPVGAVTALFGAPLFIYLLRRQM